jgi:hypothetical protein
VFVAGPPAGVSITCLRRDTSDGNPATPSLGLPAGPASRTPSSPTAIQPNSGINDIHRRPFLDGGPAIVSARLTLVVGGFLLTGLGLTELRLSSDLLSASVTLLLGLLSSAAGTTQGGWIEAALGSAARFLDVQPRQLALIPLGVGLAFASRAAAGDGMLAALTGHAWLWAAAIAMVVLGCWTRATTAGSRFGTGEAWALAVLVIAALLLRTIQLSDIPIAVSGDEGGMGLVAWEYVTHLRTNLLALGWFSFPGLYAWIVSVFQLACGRTLLAIRLPSAVAGTLSVLALYLAARTMFGRLTAILSATLLAGLHVHLLFSRIAVANVWDGLFLSLTLGGLWRGWRDDHRGAFLLSGLAIGLSLYFYATARLLPVYAVLWVLVLSRSAPRRDRRAGLICLSLAAGTVVLPLALFYLAHPSEWLAPLTRVSVFNRDQLRFMGMGDIPTNSLIAQQLFKSVLGMVIIPIQGVYSPWTPMLRPAMAMLGLVGAAMCLWRWRDPRRAMLLIGILGPILVGALSLDAPSSQRLLFAAPPLALTASLPLAALGRRLRSWRPARARLTAAIPIALALAAGLSDIHFFFSEAMPRSRFSDINSLIARELGDFLETQPAGTGVYFIKPSSLGYSDVLGLRYLAPNVQGHDLRWPTDPLPALTLPNQRLVFVALPSEAPALQAIQQAYPDGETISWVLDNRQPFFSVRLAWR